MTPAVRAGGGRAALCGALGALSTLSLPPVGIFPVLLLSVPGFITLTRDAGSRTQSFLCGWAFGCGYFILGLYWISAALFVDIAQFMWVLPLSALVGPMVFALYYGFIPLLARRWARSPVAHALAFIAVWAAIEWARGHWMTGFPWNLTGSAWSRAAPVMQSAALFGAYGLSLLTLFWAAAPLFTRRSKIILGVQVASCAACVAFGVVRLQAHPVSLSEHTVRIVQANIPQTLKWSPAENWNNLRRHVALSRADTPATFVVWPETAVSADLRTEPEVRASIADGLPRGSIGILGALRMPDGGGYANSAIALDSNGQILAAYDKHHLVPFGEYIPFRHVLKLTPVAGAISGIGDFTAGPGPATIRLGRTPAFSPLICYEVIFPGAVTDKTDRPDWLVNLTNDGWYGRTAGPYQHLESTRLRAIEEGLPIARAANTGISAMIDPMGRILARKALNEEGAIDARLPHPLPATPYARLGDAPFWAMALVMGLMAEASLRRARKNQG